MTGLTFEQRTQPDLDALARRAEGAQEGMTRYMRQVMARQAQRFQALGYAEAPKRTGRYAASITTRPLTGSNEAGFEVLSSHPLGRYIQQGTRPHVIRAKNARFLAFYWPRVGRVVFFRQVNHPGTAPNPFMQRALDAWLPGMQPDLQEIPARWVAFMKGL